MSKCIIIAQAGWVFVGDVSRDGDMIVLSNAWNVRQWSIQTKRGLGRLALEGPADEDKLDECGTVRIHALAAVGWLDCNEEAWASWSARTAKPRPATKRGGK